MSGSKGSEQGGAAETVAGETPAAAIFSGIEKTAEEAVDAVNKAAAEAVAEVGAGFGQMNDRMSELMEKNMKTMSEMSDFAKGNVEAMIESAKAAGVAAETLAGHFAETSKKHVEDAQAAFKAVTGAKTPQEFFQAQNDYARSQFEKAVANWSQLSETWLKVAGDVVQPISNRMALAADQVKKSMAH